MSISSNAMNKLAYVLLKTNPIASHQVVFK